MSDRPTAARGGVALLVLAHVAPRGLEALASAFESDRFRIYVHLDAKADLTLYSSGRRWPANLRFIDERHEVFWGGFNMVRATMALARAGLGESGNERFALVSDDTLPLLPAADIHDALASSPDRIDVGLSRRNPPYLQRYTEWFFLDSPATSARPRDVQSRMWDARALDAMQRLAGAQARGKYPFAEVWGGSQWWCLSRSTLEPIVSELESNAWVRESFEFSAVPDELAIQTLYARQKELTARSFTGPMLTDVSRQPSPFVFRSIDQVPEAPAGKLFIRKIADEAAAEMMCRLSSAWAGR